MWWALLAQGGMSLLNGQQQQAMGEFNAQAARDAGYYNAAVAREVGAWTSESINYLANLNVELGTIAADKRAEATEGIAMYNANLRLEVSKHNAGLLTEEAKLVYAAAGLEEMLFDQQADLVMGGQTAGFANRGLMLNTGVTKSLAIDTATQLALDRHIIRFNADRNAKKLLDKATASIWQGQAEANAMIFEGFTKGNVIRINQATSGMQQLGQAAYDSALAVYGAELEAEGILYESEWAARQYEAGGAQAMTSSWFQAGSTILQGYGKYRTVHGSGGGSGVDSPSDFDTFDFNSYDDTTDTLIA